MKNFKHWLATMAMLLCCLTMSAEIVQIEGVWYNIVTKGKVAEVARPTDGSTYSGAITIPATLSYNDVEYSVTSIEDCAFINSSSLTSITIPESVTSIGSTAFGGCTSLTSITIPEGVTSIEYSAFAYCSSLTSITIPESVTEIKRYAFRYCSSLAAITFSENSQLTSIGEQAFSNCTSLASITIPEGVTKIEYGAFGGCTSLTSIIFPENSQLTSIENYAFSGCSSLTAITIPEGVTEIGGGAFSNCTNLTSITIPESVNWIGENAFLDCSNLTSITIPEGVTRIQRYTFSGCSNLASITIPESVTSIEYEAFGSCTSFTSITIPEGVYILENLAFDGCSNLTTVVIHSKNFVGETAMCFNNCPELLDVYCYSEDLSLNENAFEHSFSEYATLHVPANAMEYYKTTAPWSNFGSTVSLDEPITHIALSEEMVTLTSGNSISLAVISTPEDVDKNLISWRSNNPAIADVDNTGKVTGIAPGTAIITVTANDGSGVSASCEVTVNELILGTCAAPVIDYIDGQVVLTCETAGVTFKSSITADDVRSYDEATYTLAATYTISAYTTKEHYLNSETTIVTLCWIDCTEEHADSGDETMIEIPSRPVLIQTDGGTIILTGLAEGTAMAVYDLNGVELGTATAENGTATFMTGLTTGSTAIVKIGEHSVKVLVK